MPVYLERLSIKNITLLMFGNELVMNDNKSKWLVVIHEILILLNIIDLLTKRFCGHNVLFTLQRILSCRFEYKHSYS